MSQPLDQTNRNRQNSGDRNFSQQFGDGNFAHRQAAASAGDLFRDEVGRAGRQTLHAADRGVDSLLGSKPAPTLSEQFSKAKVLETNGELKGFEFPPAFLSDAGKAPPDAARQAADQKLFG